MLGRDAIVEPSTAEIENGSRHGEVVQFSKRVWIYSAAGGAEKMCLSISRLSREPALPVSMRDRLSNTKKSQAKEKHRQKILRGNADLAESTR